MNSRAGYKRLSEAVRNVLAREWNPIELDAARGEPQYHEYEAYVPQVVQLLWTEASADEIAAHLRTIEKECMGLEPDAARCSQAAGALKSLPSINRSTT